MKTTLLLLIALCTFTLSAISQSKFGLKAGINVSNQYRSFSSAQWPAPHMQETKPMLGYQFGTFYKMPVGSNFTFATEVNFSVIGSRNRYITETQLLNPDGKTHYFNDKVGYVEIPMMLEYHLKKLYFGLGPGISFNLFSRVTNFEGDNYDGFNYRTLDAAGNFLIGYNISKNWDVNLRYSYGMLNVLEDRANQETRNRFLNASLLYALKRK